MLRTSKIIPNSTAIKQVAQHIWELALETQQRPLVLMSTAGPALALRRELEKCRPKDLPTSFMVLTSGLSKRLRCWRPPKKLKLFVDGS